jgi:cholesterol transport system auxiliary component
MSRTSRRLVLAALALMPTGCSLLGGGGPPTALYTLTTLKDLPAGPRLRLQLLIDRPTTSNALNTGRIALRRNELSFDYFAECAWTDPAPAMIQSLLVDSLQGSNRVTAVSRDTLAIRGDYELRIELRHFEAEYRGQETLPTIRIEFGLTLVRIDDRSIAGTRTVSSWARPTKNDVPSIIASFDQALHIAMRDTLTWTLAVAGSRA